MDVRSSEFARKFTRLFVACSVAFVLAGCDVKITDRTPSSFSENPSGVYTITAEIKTPGVVVEGSLKPSVVVDGQIYPMTQSALGGNLWEFDYALPPGRTEGAYYILASYQTQSGGQVRPSEAYTGLKKFTLVSRYGLSLDASRAPVGAQVTVLGRGFNDGDTVYVGDASAQTIYRSSNSLSFVVPPLPAGQNYPVTVGAPSVGLAVGTLRVDQGTLRVDPSALRLTTGQRRMLVFSIPTAAPPSGLVIDVTTDVADSVIMPEVMIPGGEQSVSVGVEGGSAGSGSLYVSAAGFGEVSIPITVSGR